MRRTFWRAALIRASLPGQSADPEPGAAALPGARLELAAAPGQRIAPLLRGLR